MCRMSPVCRNVITENSAPTPQKALASVNQSARWNSRIIENGFGLSMVGAYGRRCATRPDHSVSGLAWQHATPVVSQLRIGVARQDLTPKQTPKHQDSSA